MGTYIVLKEHGCKHFGEAKAKEAVSRIHYTDKTGAKHEGAHWTPEQIEAVTVQLKFSEGTTLWDKYVAFNSFYADLCRVLDEPQIIKSAHAFYFDDEDTPDGKIWRYVRAME